MSSPSQPVSLTATPTPSPTSTGGGGTSISVSGANFSASSSMYLYTFLATLLLLLGVSSAIVLRSIVLRRRQRRMIEAAIADGTWIPPRARHRRSGRSKRVGEKPKMFVAVLSKEEPDELEEASSEGVLKEKMKEKEKVDNVKWEDILPVSASYVTQSTTTIPPTIPKAPRPNTRGIVSTLSTPRMSPAHTPPTNTPPPELRTDLSNGDSGRHPKLIRLSVLIAMPCPRPFPTDQEDLPPMEIGVAELHVVGKCIDDGDVDAGDGK